jgi:hypothetical protein
MSSSSRKRLGQRGLADADDRRRLQDAALRDDGLHSPQVMQLEALVEISADRHGRSGRSYSTAL